MWHLKSVLSEPPNLKWCVLRCVPPYSNISKKCLLCLYEKLDIVTYPNQKDLLKKKSAVLCKCYHTNKFLLKNYTGNDFRYCLCFNIFFNVKTEIKYYCLMIAKTLNSELQQINLLLFPAINYIYCSVFLHRALFSCNTLLEEIVCIYIYIYIYIYI